MTSPIIIPDLDPANPIDPANDLLLIRQGLNDRKATVDQVTGIRLTPLSMLPGHLDSTDVLLIGRNVAGTYQNYIMPPQYLGFLNGTNCWFYQATAPLGWTIIPNTGNRVLGVADLNGNLYKGNAAPALTPIVDWQQEDWTLTIAQIPAHSHQIYVTDDSGTHFKAVAKGRSANPTTLRSSELTGGGLGHNHGNTWRPAAVVGIICTKDKDVGA